MTKKQFHAFVNENSVQAHYCGKTKTMYVRRKGLAQIFQETLRTIGKVSEFTVIVK